MKFKWIVFVLMMALFEVGFIKLGIWQYHRMHEKEALKAEFLAAVPQKTKTYTGVFDHNREVVLESQKNENLYGYRILTPLVMGNQEIIVDRGWIPRSFTPNFLQPYRTQGPQTISGVLRDVPTLHQRWFKGSDMGQGAAPILQLLKLEHIPTQEGVHRVPGVYLQATQSTNPQIKAFANPPVGGDQHKQYMYTWASLALILPVLMLMFWRQRKREQ